MSDRLDLKIDTLAHGGEGVGSELSGGEGKRCFVAGALPGEIVRAQVTVDQRRYRRARLVEIVEPSKLRTQAPCAIADRCGGCNWQHVRADAQAQLKVEIAQGQLRKCDVSVDEVHQAPSALGYRRRVRLHVQECDGDLRIGFFGAQSNDVVESDGCPIVRPALAVAMTWTKTRLGPWLRDACQIHMLEDNGRVVVGVSGWCPSESERPALSTLLEEPIAGIEFRGQRRSLRVGQPRIELSDNPEFSALRAGPFDFAQAQAAQNRVLVDTVLRFASAQGKRVLELFCGSGNFTRGLAKQAQRVFAWDDARAAIGELHRWVSLENAAVAAQHGRADRALSLAKDRGWRYDVLVLDPPRTGVGEANCRLILDLDIRRIVYVSCDPATLARDLSVLVEGGYRVQRSALIDMMPMTSEIEMVIMLEKEPKS